MTISPDTEQVLSFLDETSGNNLRKRSDLALLLEVGATYGLSDLIEKIIFSGKMIWNINKTIKRGTAPEGGLAKLERNIEDELENLRSFLNEIIEYTQTSERERFDLTYFFDKVGSSLNLIDLSHDLALLKDVQMELKKL